jgi:hypothetical protein
VDTEKLITVLAADAGPVRPLAPPSARLGRWLLITVPFVAAGVLAFGLRADLAAALVDPRFALTGILAVATAMAGASAALVLAVPGAERTPVARWLPVALLAVWSAAIIALLSRQGFVMEGSLAWPWSLCIAKVVVTAAPPAYVLFRMVGRAAPLRLSWAAGLAAIAGLSAGALGVQFVCENWHAGHLLLTHYAPVVVPGALLALVGRRWLEWAPRF